MSAAPLLRLYGRRKGKQLRPGQARLLRELLPRVEVGLPEPGRLLEPWALFAPRPAAVWLEIGFGGGEHLAAEARAHPAIGFIGCEPFLNGVVKLLAELAREPLSNLRVFPDDARFLLAALAPASLGRVTALFPDPWPKKRHHKRRLIQPATLELLARVMAEGAELRLATDERDYARWMLDELAAQAAFEGPEGGPFGHPERPADWPGTRYEAKARAAGRPPVYLVYRRRAGAR